MESAGEKCTCSRLRVLRPLSAELKKVQIDIIFVFQQIYNFFNTKKRFYNL